MTVTWFILFFISYGSRFVLGISNIDGIRLHPFSEYGSNIGRIEVLSNGTWGTICGYWNIDSANIACRMLGYSHATCASVNVFPESARSGVPQPIICGIYCDGDERSLDQCSTDFSSISCFICTALSNGYATVVCSNTTTYSTEDTILPDITGLQVLNSTTRSIAIYWDAVHPLKKSDLSYQYRVLSSSPFNSIQSFIISVNESTADERVTAVITNLARDSQFLIRVRLEASPSFCFPNSRTDRYGNYSDTLIASTKNKTDRMPEFQIRLVPPVVGVQYMGRLEVNINSTWGTVSATSSSFGKSAGDIVCNQLNYSRACSNVYRGRIGQGRGRIWLYEVNCSGTDEIFDDCSYRYCEPGNRICRHNNDVGVVCVPEPEEFLPAPEDFNIRRSSGSLIRVTWKRYKFPRHITAFRSRQLSLEYTRSDQNSTSQILIHKFSTSYRIVSLKWGTTINATIRGVGYLSPNYGCYTLFKGARSKSVSLELVESPPSTPPRKFHISVVNCTTVRAEWMAPSYNDLNGILRGYKLTVQSLGSNKSMIDLSPDITEYLIKHLTPSTSYEVSVLAYTIGDGPKSIHLLATTNPSDICHSNIIDIFGIKGNGFDRVTLLTYTGYSATILCGSSLPGVVLGWYFSNGTSVGNKNRNLREGNLVNGTRALQFGTFSGVSPCDSGVYICRANLTHSAKAEQRPFKVTVNTIPPTPIAPKVLNATSTSVTFKWTNLTCDGGHSILSYTARLLPHINTWLPIWDHPFFFGIYRYVYGLDSRSSNATVHGLNSATNYNLQIRAEGLDRVYSSFSPVTTVTTLPPDPIPPYNVTAVLVEHNTIQVSWSLFDDITRRLGGTVVYFTVYAIPFASEPSSLSTFSGDMLQTLSKNFSSGVTSGNLTLNQLGVEYHVRVTATFYYSSTRKNQESPLSALQPESSIFVPIIGLPTLSNLSVIDSTNASISLSWTIPITKDTISGFYVEYSAMVEGRSALGNLIRYVHKGNLTVSAAARRAVIQPLVPQSQYILKVAILTARGEGAQVEATAMTLNAQSDLEKFSYFHVRFGPVLSCSNFRKDIDGQEGVVRRQMLLYLNSICKCGLTNLNIENGLFSCGEKNHEIIYRAHILGTTNYSATGLIYLLHTWIRSGRAFIAIDSFRMRLDPSCPTILDTLDDPDCPVELLPSTTDTAGTDDSQSSKPSPKINANVQSGANPLTLGGVVIGVIIAMLLFILIAVVVVYLVCKTKKTSGSLGTSTIQSKKFNNRASDCTPFADMEESKESSLFEEKLS